MNFFSAVQNEEYINKLADKFNLTCHFASNGYGDCDVYVTRGLTNYKIETNTNKLSLYASNSKFESSSFSKKFFKPRKTFSGVDCWFEVLRYISKSV